MLNIYSIIAPIAIILLALEIIYCLIKKNGIYSFQETFTNISTGVGNQLVNLLVMAVVFSLYEPLYRLSPFKIKEGVGSMIILLIAVDFIFYWVHRWGHEFNIGWAAHSPHHSGEEMNLGLALRASVTMRLYSFFFFWPLALLGFSPEMIYAATAIQLLISFWHHTKLIKKMPWFEIIFNSPSHHRVHHGTNAKYLDKNYGEIFIIWDKMFGTFQKEEEEVNYGVLRQPKSWNPLVINFHFWGMLWQDFRETKSLWDKMRIWFMPLGWRPKDVITVRRKVRPFEKGEYIRYHSQEFPGFRWYLIWELFVSFGIMLFILNTKNNLLMTDRLVLGIYLWLGMLSWGAILESKKWGLTLSLLRSLILIWAIFLGLGQAEEKRMFYIILTSSLSLVGCLGSYLKMIFLIEKRI